MRRLGTALALLFVVGCVKNTPSSDLQNTASSDPQEIIALDGWWNGYFLSLKLLELTTDEFLKDVAQLSKANLGISLEQGEGGVEVVGTIVGSPAHRAGIRAGAMLVSVNGVPVDEVDAALAYLRESEEAVLAFKKDAPAKVAEVISLSKERIPCLERQGQRLQEITSSGTFIGLRTKIKNARNVANADESLWREARSGTREQRAEVSLYFRQQKIIFMNAYLAFQQELEGAAGTEKFACSYE